MALIPRISREQRLAALAYLPVAAAILLALALARSAVVDRFEQLLQAETKIAAELLRGHTHQSPPMVSGSPLAPRVSPMVPVGSRLFPSMAR